LSSCFIGWWFRLSQQHGSRTNFGAFIFVALQVFILWALNFIAIEIENPFGTDANDIDG